MSVVIPFGRLKGVPLEEAPDEGLLWVLKAVEKKLEADPNGRFAGENRDFCEAVRRELVGRGHASSEVGGAQNPAALAVVQPTDLKTGSYADPEEVVDALQDACSKANLVAPSPDCGTLPDGCEVQLSAVVVDASKDTFPAPAGGGKGLGKSALDKIAWALGVDWDGERSRRLDDGKDPRYCHFRAVGYIRNFDGSQRTIKAEKEMDLRDGSPQCVGIVEQQRKAKAKAERENRTYEGDLGESQIRELRMHILSHAETKARLRAIRSLGLRASYSLEELRKPFVCAKLVFTGRSNDPAAAAQFRGEIAKAFLGPRTGSREALYGPEPTAPALSAGHAAPPVGSVPADDDAIEARGEEVKSEPAAAKQPAKPTKKPEQQSFDDVGDEPDYGTSKKY